MFFALMYVPHGGSGIPGLSQSDLMEYDVQRIEWLGDRLNDQRRAEAAAMRKK